MQKEYRFTFDDPELEGKGEKVVIKGESLRRLIKERSKVNKTKLKKNISRNGKKNSELGNSAREEKFRLIQGDKTKFSNFTQVDDFYESKRSGLVIRLPTEFTSEDSVEKDRRHALEVDHKNDSLSNSPENDFISKRTYSRISLTKKENVQEIPFASDNKSFVDPTKDSIKSEENELVSSRSPRFSEEKDDSQNISFEKSDDFLESKIEDFINSRENSVGSTGFNLIKDNRSKDEFGNDDDLNSIEEPAIVDDIGSITDDNYLEEVIRKDRDDNSDNEPVLKTIKYQAQILSKQKNLSHNGYYYKTVDHVELFKTGTAYLEDFKNGLRSFAFSSLGVTDSKQKSIFGICSFFNYHTDVNTLIVSEDFKKSFFSFYIKELKPKNKPIFKDGESYKLYSGPGFDILDFYEVKKIYSKVSHYDYEEFLRELTNKYDLVLWDLPNMDILDENKEIFFPVIRMLDNVSLVVRGKETSINHIRSLADYYSKYQVDIKGVLFDSKKKPLKKKGALELR